MNRRGIRGLFLSCLGWVFPVLVSLFPAGTAAQEPDQWPVLVVEQLFVLKGSPGKPFRQPTDVAVGSQGLIYAMDGLNGRVVVFDGQGSYRFSFGANGNGPGEMDMAIGLGISPAGEVFVADSGNHRVQVFDAKGKYRRAFSLKNGEKADPTDVMVPGLKDFCYVVDNDNHQVQVYHAKTGKYLREWGGHGKNLGEFRYPATISVDSYNHIYVVDVMNARVQTFDPFGEGSRVVAGWGVKMGKVFRPKGVAIDGEERIFISDSYMGTVQVFRPRGDLCGVVGDAGGKTRRFTTPTNIVLDPQGRLLVVETRANQISVYRLLK